MPKLTLPTKAQLIEIAKRSAVTFAAVFIPSFGTAAAGAHYELAVLGSLALSSAAAAVNVVIRLIWKPALVEYVPVFPTGPAPPSPSAP